MQIRFDGTLGFPGGIVDKGETPEVAVNREMCEELGCSPDSCIILEKDHVMSQVSYKTQFCLHFYAKQISLATLQQMERSAIICSDYGSEVCVNVQETFELLNTVFSVLYGHYDNNCNVGTRIYIPKPEGLQSEGVAHTYIRQIPSAHVIKLDWFCGYPSCSHTNFDPILCRTFEVL